MSTLLSKHGLHLGHRFALKDLTRLGRAPDNEISLNDHLVSRYHSEITRENGAFILRDLGSKNGVKINGKPVTSYALARGDRLTIGSTTLVYEAPQDLHSSRYSNRMVRLVTVEDPTLRMFSGDEAPTPDPDSVLRLIDHASQLLEMDHSQVDVAMRDLLGELMKQFGAHDGAIMKLNSNGEALPLIALGREDALLIAELPLQISLAEGRFVITSSVRGWEPEYELLSGMALIQPLKVGKQTFGAMYLQRNDDAEPFVENDVGLLAKLSRLISGAVRHALQFEKSNANPRPSDPFIGLSVKAQAVRDRIKLVARNDSTVLITGETGTGKELTAHAIHAASPRAKGPIVVIDCSTIPANLMESELFGYEAGAFTGADRLKLGKVEMAEGGTLVLDEIGEMSPDLQPKLLRFLEERLFYRVGGRRPIHADVRIIAATNRNLEKEVELGHFRSDLLYRLNVVDVKLPPLRERKEDIHPLVEHFAPKLSARVNKPFLGLVTEASALMAQYHWPGNVRELRHSLERALILSDDGILRTEHFQFLPSPHSIHEEEFTTDSGRTASIEQTSPGHRNTPGKPPTMEEVEIEAIQRALRYANGNRIKAAEALDIHRNTLRKKIQTYGIEVAE